MKKTRYVLVVVLALLALFFVVQLVHFPVNRNLKAVIIIPDDDDNSLTLDVDIGIAGYYKLVFWGDDVFCGVISIENFPITEHEISLELRQNDSFFSAGMLYQYTVNELPGGGHVYESRAFGVLYVSNNFEELIINVYSIEDAGIDSGLIVAPADSYEQAKVQLQRFSEMFKSERLFVNE